MNELIKINYDSDRQTTSARLLWEFLGKPWGEFMKWFNKFSEYGFTEDIDYRVIEQSCENPAGGRPATDYEITIDMAKELSMLQKTERGKRARQYFIELEKRWNSPEAVMARALKMADTKILEYKTNILHLESQVKELTPPAEFGMTVGSSKGSILIRDYVKLLANDDIKIGQDEFFAWLHVHGYLYRTKEYKPQWVAYRQYIDQGLFKMKEMPISTKEHGDTIKYTVRVTGKGQRYFYDKLKSWNNKGA